VPDTRPAPAPAGASAGEPRQHIVALDLMRLLIVAFVVGVHTLTTGGGTVTVLLGAFVTVFHTSRELFFLLTAFVLTYNYGPRPHIRWLGFWRRRYSLVLPAYLAWSLIYFLADHQRLDPISGAVLAFGHDLLTAGARYQLYFLLVTMQVYLAFPLLRWLLRRTAGYHLALFLAACGYQLALTVAIQRHAVTTGLIGAWLRSPNEVLPSYLLYVLAGGIAAWHFDRFVAFTRRHLTAARLALVAGVGAGLGTYFAELAIGGLDPAAASAVFQPVVVVESLAFGWALFAVGTRWADAGARHRRLISAGADSSFGIFLAHPLVLQGALALAGATGVLAAVQHAPAALELAALLGVAVPLIYGVSGALVFLARRTPLSLALTGRPQTARAGQGAGRPAGSPAMITTPATPQPAAQVPHPASRTTAFPAPAQGGSRIAVMNTVNTMRSTDA
jgi:peptidoglycan/LPS O-acetylase OafA/YrhL